MKVSYYRCFASDQRISMQVYADALMKALDSSCLELRSFQPCSRLEALSSSRLVMRYLRYFRYPRMLSTCNADIHHIIDHGYAHLVANLSPGKRCITVHDLIPMLAWKGLLNQGDKKGDIVYQTHKPRLNLYSLSFLSKFDQIIAVSQSTADDLVEYLGLQPQRISVIPPIIDRHFSPVSDQRVDQFAEQHKLRRDIKWIMVSGQEFYKNHLTSLRVLKELDAQSDAKIKLLKTGLPSAHFDTAVAELGLQGLVRQIFVEDQAQLPLLYNLVDCLLFPSLYEGFGMPVIEALACGTPVIISDRGSLPEVAGGLAPAYNPFDIDGLSKAVHSSLFQDDQKLKIAAQAPAWVRQFQADRVAASMQNLYQKMLACQDQPGQMPGM
ncbi:MAG: glycosyltransferase family 4 protein [Gammaproteobacteria bacterium]|nr:glycosyltransferase family 4 protein [Gammaproteobacteria bacterium]